MKRNIHPQYVDCKVVCSCGNTFMTRSTKPELKIDICNECHPFFTGQQKFVDTGGRVQRFENRFGNAKDLLKAQQEEKKAARAKELEAEAEARKIKADQKAAEKEKRTKAYEQKIKKLEEKEKAEKEDKAKDEEDKDSKQSSDSANNIEGADKTQD